jgi:hypothetical protein
MVPGRGEKVQQEDDARDKGTGGRDEDACHGGEDVEQIIAPVSSFRQPALRDHPGQTQECDEFRSCTCIEKV